MEYFNISESCKGGKGSLILSFTNKKHAMKVNDGIIHQLVIRKVGYAIGSFSQLTSE
jgi:hypothetical protein